MFWRFLSEYCSKTPPTVPEKKVAKINMPRGTKNTWDGYLSLTVRERQTFRV